MKTSSTPISKLSTTSKKILIVGAGYLGLRLARRLSPHHIVMTANRRFFCPDFSLDPGEQKPFDGDWSALLKTCAPDHIFVCWAPKDRSLKAYRHTYIDGLQSLLNASAECSSRPSIIASGSSAVWEGSKGEIVDEHSIFAVPQKEKNKILLEAEQLIETHHIDHARPAVTLRLSGLYGPDRLPGLRRLNSEMEIREQPDGWINLLHIDDAVSAMMCAFETSLSGTWLVNGETIQRKKLYESIQQQNQTPQPRWSSSPSASLGRQLKSQAFRQKTSWKPEHNSVLTWMVTEPKS